MQHHLPFVTSDDRFVHTSTHRQLCSALEVTGGPAWPDRFGAQLASWRGATADTPIRTLSLFSGAGGLDLGFHDCGFEIVAMVEVEPKFAETLSFNGGTSHSPLGSAEVLCSDIRDFSSHGFGRVDFILGGPPCQTFSAAGRRAHGVPGTDDPRGQLFLEYLRLLGELQPEAFLFENVYGITGAQGGKAWRSIIEGFRSAGYNVSFRILDAADYGVPQHRERLVIVGTRNQSFLFPRPTHGPDSFGDEPHFVAGAAIADLEGMPLDVPSHLRGRYGALLNEIPPGLNYSFFTSEMGHPNPLFAWRSKFSDFLYKADPLLPTRTIKAQGGQYTGPFHWESRPFTLHELKRLQTFPDAFEIQGNRQVAIQQIGNSVPPQLARILGLAVLEQVFEVQPPAPFPLLEPGETLSFRKLKRHRTAAYQRLAKSAVVASMPEDKASTSSGRISYSACLTEGFDLLQSEPGGIQVTETLSRARWLFELSDHETSGSTSFVITIKPRKAWAIPADLVELRGNTRTGTIFTAAWKAFERRLADSHIKADLVQLTGYYQYAPAIAAKLDFADGEAPPTDAWRVVQSVVEGAGVRLTSHVATLGFTWGVDPVEVPEICAFLRSLGFEVRNTNTNGQIPRDHYLIPYQFPTLTGMSVQLRKHL